MVRTLGTTIVYLAAIVLVVGGLYTGLYWIAVAGILLIAGLAAGV